jgi:Ca-activated chloride channel homolog
MLAGRVSLLLAAMVATVPAAGCKKKEEVSPPPPAPTPAASKAATPTPEPGTVTLIVAYGSEKKTWLEEAITAFHATNPRTPAGHPIRIDARSMGSGEAAAAILDGSLKPHVFSPASTAYLALLNESWMTSPTAPHTAPLAPEGEPLVLSPIVIAIWKPMAEALGWPGKELGWSDILRVSRDKRGWGGLDHPEWGAFKLGHTHPDYSNSGLLAVLAEAYAATGKTRGLAAADLDAPATGKTIGEIENAIVHYGKSTTLFADKMLERGPAYMSAAVLYENLVIESYGSAKAKDAPFPIVAIYPTEGTFWSDHPYSVLAADWVGAEEKAAAAAFLAFLKAGPQQQLALALGFRPADPSIAIGAPIDAAHGVDAGQPQTLLEVPPGAVLKRLLALWHEVKKSTDVTLVFDKSGSMQGQPLAEAKQGAKAFLDGLGDRDEVTVLFFDSVVHPPAAPAKLGVARARLQQSIDGTFAEGGTALFDAVAEAHTAMLKRARAEPGRIHALVVMTDGVDESSTMDLATLTKRFTPEEAPVKIFTIAYGTGADSRVLDQIAAAAQGTSARGSTATIVQVYRDLSAFF